MSLLDAEYGLFREALVREGFSDDGEMLRGEVAWEHPSAGSTTATIAVAIPEAFPFVPPRVWVTRVGFDMPLTFHVEYAEEGEEASRLCLWESSNDVAQAPWREARAVVTRVAGHLRQTALGWPGDSDCDLERYLKGVSGLVLYNRDEVATLSGSKVRVQHDYAANVITLTRDVRSVALGKARGAKRKDRNLAYIGDIGELNAPIRSWADVRGKLGEMAEPVARDIMLGVATWLVLGYSRSGRRSVLVLRVSLDRDQIQLFAVESADTSYQTRQLRAGLDRDRLTDARVAIVGMGAIGSFAADFLFRAGVRHLTLIDFEVLRPGNLVRHLLGERYVGMAKADGVAAYLAERGTDASHVRSRRARVDSPGFASSIVRGYDLVIDATGDALATSLFTYAANPDQGPPQVLSVCAQRQGEVIRVDVLPGRPDEPHLPALPRRATDQLDREQGCGSPVSLTPPGAVVAAAELVTRLAVTVLTNAQNSVPASTVTVFVGQEEESFTRPGSVTSEVSSDSFGAIDAVPLEST